MLAEAGLVRLVARAIRENGWAHLVVDPVMVSTSGARLLTTEAEEVIREDLLPLAALVTPNLDEAAILTGRVVHDLATMERAATTLLRFGAGAVLVKGGHLSTGEIVDVLATARPAFAASATLASRPRPPTEPAAPSPPPSPPAWRSAGRSRRRWLTGSISCTAPSRRPRTSGPATGR